MTPADIDRVFGRSRLRMVTGAHVEVFREADGEFYVSIFPNSKIGQVARHGPEDRVWMVEFELDGQPFAAVNADCFRESLSGGGSTHPREVDWQVDPILLGELLDQ